MTLFFEVPGEPVGKARPRFTRKGHAYTPKKTSDYEREVRNSFRIAYPDHEPFTGAVTMGVEAVFGVPKSWPKWKREAALRGEIPHISKPDYTNVCKSIEDGIEGLAYINDSQINCDAGGVKRYGSRPRVEVNITGGGKP